MRRLVFILLCAAQLSAQAQKPVPTRPSQPQAAQPQTTLDLIDPLLKSATQALNKRQLEKAESDLRRVVGLSLNQVGGAASGLKDYPRAERAYKDASRSSSSVMFRALLGLGNVYLRTGRYDAGIATAEQILPLDLLNPEARSLLGKLYFMKRDFDLAAQELHRALTKQPDDSKVAYTLALAELRLKRLDSAQRVLAGMAQKLGDTPQLHILVGRAFRQTGYPQEAIAEFTRALQFDPRVPRAHYYLGLTYLTMQGGAVFAEARKEFEAELVNNPNEFLPNFFLGVVTVRSRDYEAGRRYLNKAVELNPTNPDPYAYLGQALFQSGDSDGSIPYLKKSLELTKDESRNGFQLANTLFMLGQALRKAGQIEQATAYLARSQELKAKRAQEQQAAGTAGNPAESNGMTAETGGIPESEEPAVVLDVDPPDESTRKQLEAMVDAYSKTAALACQGLGRLEIMRENFVQAANWLDNAAYWDPSLPEIFFNLGFTRFKANQPEKAAPALLTALEHSPSKPEILQLLAPLAFQLVDRRYLDEAGPVVEALLKIHPEVADLYLLRGRILALRGKWDDSLAQIRLALQKNPAIPEAHYIGGTILIRQGEMDKAREEFDNELKLTPRHPQAMYHKAFVLVLQRKSDEAIPLLEEVIRLAPDYAEPYYQLGRALLEKNETLLAIANLETAAKLNPEAYYIQYQLSRAYTKSQRVEEAQQALQKYRELKKSHDLARDANRSQVPAIEELSQ